MLHRLTQDKYDRVRPLFEGLAYQLSSTAVLAGTSPGAVWANDPGRPRTAFLASPEGCFLAGDAENEAVNQALNELIVGGILSRHEAIVVVWHPVTWKRKLDLVLEGCRPIEERRMHYRLDRLRVDWRSAVPSGFAVERIDAGLLNRPGLTIPAHVTGWMKNNWESVGGFLQNAFGFCTIHNDRMASWSLADCIAGNACEIGIQTAEDYRQRGLATLTAAAMVDHALSHGLSEVGWHCHESNRGSQGVAEKVGFVHERDYVHYLCLAGDNQPSARPSL